VFSHRTVIVVMETGQRLSLRGTAEQRGRRTWIDVMGISPLLDRCQCATERGFLHMHSTPPFRFGAEAGASAGANPVARFLTASLAREMGILLALSVMFPFMIHILPVPGDARLGPRLLPMFYAPLLAVLWGRVGSALLLALVAPWLNWTLTAHPAPLGAVVMTVELLGFVLVFRFLMAKIGAQWFLAAPAFFSGKIAAVVVVTLFPVLIGGRAPLGWAAQSVLVGVPGIAILVLINWLALRHYPSSPAGGGPAAA
jgi:hypothetical protein